MSNQMYFRKHKLAKQILSHSVFTTMKTWAGRIGQESDQRNLGEPDQIKAV